MRLYKNLVQIVLSGVLLFSLSHHPAQAVVTNIDFSIPYIASSIQNTIWIHNNHDTGTAKATFSFYPLAKRFDGANAKWTAGEEDTFIEIEPGEGRKVEVRDLFKLPGYDEGFYDSPTNAEPKPRGGVRVGVWTVDITVVDPSYISMDITGVLEGDNGPDSYFLQPQPVNRGGTVGEFFKTSKTNTSWHDGFIYMFNIDGDDAADIAVDFYKKGDDTVQATYRVTLPPLTGDEFGFTGQLLQTETLAALGGAGYWATIGGTENKRPENMDGFFKVRNAAPGGGALPSSIVTASNILHGNSRTDAADKLDELTWSELFHDVGWIDCVNPSSDQGVYAPIVFVNRVSSVVVSDTVLTLVNTGDVDVTADFSFSGDYSVSVEDLTLEPNKVKVIKFSELDANSTPKGTGWGVNLLQVGMKIDFVNGNAASEDSVVCAAWLTTKIALPQPGQQPDIKDIETIYVPVREFAGAGTVGTGYDIRVSATTSNAETTVYGYNFSGNTIKVKTTFHPFDPLDEGFTSETITKTVNSDRTFFFLASQEAFNSSGDVVESEGWFTIEYTDDQDTVLSDPDILVDYVVTGMDPNDPRLTWEYYHFDMHRPASP